MWRQAWQRLWWRAMVVRPSVFVLVFAGCEVGAAMFSSLHMNDFFIFAVLCALQKNKILFQDITIVTMHSSEISVYRWLMLIYHA